MWTPDQCPPCLTPESGTLAAMERLVARFGKKIAGLLAVLALAVLTQNCGGGNNSGNNPPPPPPPGPVSARLVSFATGMVKRRGLRAAKESSNRLFVVEQRGTICIIQNGSVLATPFLDIRTLVESGGEKGLLGMALHPQFQQNRRFFLNYTTSRLTGALQSVIAEYQVSPTDP